MEDTKKRTKEKLLDVARDIFAEKGFHGANIREICKTAGANVAAVNYHFGDKMGLYKDTLIFAFEAAKPIHTIPQLQDNPDHPEDLLLQWIEWYLERLLGNDGGFFVQKLMAKELREPTIAFDYLIENSMRPTYESLEKIIIALLQQSEEKLVKLCCHSIIGQCLIYLMGRPIMDKLHPDQCCYRHQDSKKIATHIHIFSIAGINIYKAQLAERKEQ